MNKMATIPRLLVDAPRALARRTSGAYRREIDGLRYFAIAFVLIGHLCERSQRFSGGTVASGDRLSHLVYYLLQRPGIGVLLFFSISGFVIFSPVSGKTQSAVNPEFLKSYFRRRALRIEPPYLLLLIATYILIKSTGFVPPNTHRYFQAPASLTESLFASLVYSHGWIFGTLPRLLPPGWSLEIEIQFYILAPIIFFLYLGIGTRWARAAIGVAALAASLVWSAFIVPSDTAPHWDLTVLKFAPFFLTGILIKDFEAELTAFAQGLQRTLGAALGWFGLAILMVAGWYPGGPLWIGIPIETAEVFGCLMMFLGALRGRGSFFAFCASGWVSLIGGACYSIYLTHLQVMQMASSVVSHFLPHALTNTPLIYLSITVVLILPLTITAGLIFYAVVERTFMLKNWPELLRQFIVRQAMRLRPRGAT